MTQSLMPLLEGVVYGLELGKAGGVKFQALCF